MQKTIEPPAKPSYIQPEPPETHPHEKYVPSLLIDQLNWPEGMTAVSCAVHLKDGGLQITCSGMLGGNLKIKSRHHHPVNGNVLKRAQAVIDDFDKKDE